MILQLTQSVLRPKIVKKKYNLDVFVMDYLLQRAIDFSLVGYADVLIVFIFISDLVVVGVLNFIVGIVNVVVVVQGFLVLGWSQRRKVI